MEFSTSRLVYQRFMWIFLGAPFRNHPLGLSFEILSLKRDAKSSTVRRSQALWVFGDCRHTHYLLTELAPKSACHLEMVAFSVEESDNLLQEGSNQMLGQKGVKPTAGSCFEAGANQPACSLISAHFTSCFLTDRNAPENDGRSKSLETGDLYFYGFDLSNWGVDTIQTCVIWFLGVKYSRR